VEPKFVGADRRVQVERLLDLVSHVASRQEPTLVVLVAAPGWGKTRIIQEFYRKLAAGQPPPAYWPANLLTEAADGELGLSELTASRKTVRYRGSFVPPADAKIPWLWLAPAAGRLSDGSPAPAFDGLVSQLTPHSPALLKRLDAHDASGRDRMEAIRAAVGELALGVTQASERPQQLSGLMSWLLAPVHDSEVVPMVLVLDDAHELDEPTVGFVREVLAADLPVLVIATTWPEKLIPVGNRPLPPFCCYLIEASGSSRIRQEWVGELAEDDLVDYVVSQFPATDQNVAASLARRADHNPYALRLLLNTPRVAASIRAGAITLDPREIAELNGQLEALLAEHWNELPIKVRQVLVAAALLGQSFIDEVLEAGLRRFHPSAGLGDALASSWIRPLGGSERILEFAERLRYEIAKDDVPDFLSVKERAEICRGALRALRLLLPAEPEGVGRIVLLALHVLLAKENVEDDLAAAAASAAELAERARSEHRRVEGIEYYRQAIAWAESSQPLPARELVRYLVDYSAMNRVQYGKSAGEPPAERAIELADRYLDQDDELPIHARCTLARARRRREDSTAYASAHTLFTDAQELLNQLETPSAEAVRDVRSLQIGFVRAEGQFSTGAELARSLAEFCEEHFGSLHRYTLDALSDLGYCLHRAGGANEAITIRRTLLERRIRRSNDAAHLQTAGAKTDLAHSLLSSRDPRNLDEAEQLVEEAITRKSRAFGFDARPTQLSRSLRTRIWMARGLLVEAAGSLETAMNWFARAADEAARICALRKDEDPSARYALSLQRHGETLACLRQADAVTVLDDAIDIRESHLAQDYAFWAVRDCAKSLWWAYQRLGRSSEADAVARRYRLIGASDDWMPAFVPDMRESEGNIWLSHSLPFKCATSAERKVAV
jgi:hypothetical protein